MLVELIKDTIVRFAMEVGKDSTVGPSQLGHVGGLFAMEVEEEIHTCICRLVHA